MNELAEKEGMRWSSNCSVPRTWRKKIRPALEKAIRELGEKLFLLAGKISEKKKQLPRIEKKILLLSLRQLVACPTPLWQGGASALGR
ncbi:MAG: hypothetical protein U5L09_05240 [Bacteroidales bacterium]|nr:hypothetical protein [Bacteroidales bacterium]